METVRRRNAATIGLAAVLALGLGTVTFGLARMAAARGGDAALVLGGARNSDLAEVNAGVAPSTVPAAAPEVPTTIATTTRTEAPATTAPSRTGGYGPRAPETVDASAGQNDWTGVSNGVTLHLHMEPAAPRAGDVVHFTVEATSTSEPCCGVHLLYGDGYSFDAAMGFSCPNGGPAGPGTRREETTHVYNGEGRWDFMLGAMTGNCTRDVKNANMIGSLTIAAGGQVMSGGQGPSRPTVTVDTYFGTGRPDAPNELLLAAEAKDADGYITKIAIDWGDGTTGERAGDGMPCRPSTVGWPLESWAQMVPGPNQLPPSHRYAQPGTYKVTATAYSAGCDGADVQTASASLSWTWGPPLAPPSTLPALPPSSPPTWPAGQPCPTTAVQPPGCPRQ